MVDLISIFVGEGDSCVRGVGCVWPYSVRGDDGVISCALWRVLWRVLFAGSSLSSLREPDGAWSGFAVVESVSFLWL